MKEGRKGLLLMLLPTFFWPFGDGQVRLITTEFSISIIIVVWSRMFGQLVFLSPLFVRAIRNGELQVSNMRLQIVRGVCYFIPVLVFSWAMRYVPVADAQAIISFHPLAASVLAAIFLNEKLTRRKIAALLIGLLGVFIIVRPGMGVMHPAAFIVISCGLFFSIHQVVSKKLLLVSNHISTLFFTTVVCVVLATLLLAFADFPTLPGRYILLLSVIGIWSAIGDYFMTASYRYADASTLAPMYYLHLLWATVIGYFMFNEYPDIPTIVGALVLVIVGIFNFKSTTN